MRNRRAVAHRNLGCHVLLAALRRAGQRHKCFNQRYVGALAYADHVARDRKTRLRARTHEEKQQRFVDLRLIRDAHHGTVSGVRRVQGQHGIVITSLCAQECGGLRRRQSLSQRPDVDGAPRPNRRQVFAVGTVDEHHLLRIDTCQRSECCAHAGARYRRLIAGAQRQRLLQRVAQIGIFPCLNAPVRQTQRPKTSDRRIAHLARLSTAGELILHRRKVLGERLLHLGLQHSYVHRTPPQRHVLSRRCTALR